jgi:hypothetical protein
MENDQWKAWEFEICWLVMGIIMLVLVGMGIPE